MPAHLLLGPPGPPLPLGQQPPHKALCPACQTPSPDLCTNYMARVQCTLLLPLPSPGRCIQDTAEGRHPTGHLLGISHECRGWHAGERGGLSRAFRPQDQQGKDLRGTLGKQGCRALRGPLDGIRAPPDSPRDGTKEGGRTKLIFLKQVSLWLGEADVEASGRAPPSPLPSRMLRVFQEGKSTPQPRGGRQRIRCQEAAPRGVGPTHTSHPGKTPRRWDCLAASTALLGRSLWPRGGRGHGRRAPAA